MSKARRILVVEDEWLLATDLCRQLEDAGYTVIGPAPSVDEALKLLGERRADAAVLDVQLMGETSFAIAAYLTEQSIPFFFISGHSAADFHQLKGHTVLSKPASWSVMLQTLQQKLSDRK